MAISILVGGHAFGAAPAQLKSSLYVAIATGIAMTFLEAYPKLSFVFEGWGLLLMAKIALLCVIPFAWKYRVAILLAAVAIAAIGSHMPARFRHYSVLYGRVTKN